MDTRIKDLLSFCSKVDFGAVKLSREEEGFRGELNREMLSLCEYLPKSTRTEAAIFLVKYMQAFFKGGFDFVSYFYPPAWSVLFWLIRSRPDGRMLDPNYVKHAKIGHTMAMFLHALDDHLTDGQLPVTHLALLMRSQSWVMMHKAYERLAKGVEKGTAIVRDLIDDYYSSINRSDETKSLDSYCEFFRNQMATWLVVPILLAKKICPDERYSHLVESAYCSFGIAWRLLDDLQDIEKDMMSGCHSSIYVSLNDDLRSRWDKEAKEKKRNSDYVPTVLTYVLEREVIDSIRERVCSELESASSLSDTCGLSGWAGEFRSLMKPLRNKRYRS
jgi:hypothetical protein